MKFIDLPLPGLKLIEPVVFGDHRGFFMETYHIEKFKSGGITDTFIQDNVSLSGKGTFRGLHFQLQPYSQGKLVRVVKGMVWDVVVDIRSGSPTYGKWHGEYLSEENKRMMYVPTGFAHGFLVVSETAEFHYKCTHLYHPSADRGIRFDDPAIGIQFPDGLNPALLSEKDKKSPFLSEVETSFTF